MFEAELEKKGRRQFVKVAAGAGLAAAALGGGGYALVRAQEAEDAKLGTLPWPKVTLAPEQVMARALESVPKGGCGFATFEALAGSAADVLGDPYRQFPFAMFRFASGGIEGRGTVCGALNGAAAAIELLSPAPAPVVDALFHWYEHEYLPDRALASAKFPLVASVAGSPLCKESVARWSAAASQAVDCEARTERCALLCACVARRAAELLGNQAQGRPLQGALGDAPQRGCDALVTQTT